MCLTCLGSWVSFGEPASGRALVVGCASRSCRARCGGLEDLAGVEVGDGDVVVVGECEDAFAGVRGADAEVVHAAGAAQAHLAVGVEAVVAQPVVAGGVPVGGREGFGGRAVGLSGVLAVKRAVGAMVVVVFAEPVELALQVGAGRGRRVGGEPALQGLVEAFDLALGLRCPGDPFFWRMPRSEQVFERVASAGEAGGVDAAVVGQRAAGGPYSSMVSRKTRRPCRRSRADARCRRAGTGSGHRAS